MNYATVRNIRHALIVGFVFFGINLEAQQEVIAPLPASINGILQQAGLPAVSPGTDPSFITSVDRPESPFQFPPFVFDPHILYRFLYEYGVLVRPGHPETTLIDTFAPGISMEIGAHWNADYTANWDVYSNHAFKDTLGHSVTIVGTQTVGDWTATVTQSYNYSSQPLVETGIQTTIQNYSTGLNVTHSIGEHFLEETIATQNLRYAVAFTDSYQWTVDEWLHYRFASQLDAALGGGAGYVHESHGADDNFTRPEAQLSWQPTDKLEFKASGGLEHRVFLDYPRTSINTPTYDFSAQYSPFETTKLTLDFARQISPSFFANQSDKIANVSLSLSQRLLERFYLTGTISHNDVTYISTGQMPGTLRDDAQITYNLMLSTSVFKRGTVSVTCFRTRNSSSITGFGFETTQFALQFGYRY